MFFWNNLFFASDKRILLYESIWIIYKICINLLLVIWISLEQTSSTTIKKAWKKRSCHYTAVKNDSFGKKSFGLSSL